MKSIFKNKLNLFLFFLIIINLIYIKNISYFNLEILKNSFNKNWIPIYSIHVSEVIESKYLLKKNNISKFNISQKIIKKSYCCKTEKQVEEADQYAYFRIITYNYPIKFDLNSEYFLFYKNEENPKTCKEIDKGKYLKLLKC